MTTTTHNAIPRVRVLLPGTTLTLHYGPHPGLHVWRPRWHVNQEQQPLGVQSQGQRS